MATNHKELGQHRGRVTNITYKAELRDNMSLTRIEFGAAYFAMEKADLLQPTTHFTIGEDYLFEVTHEGRGIKPDWIRCVGKAVPSDQPGSQPTFNTAPYTAAVPVPMRECNMIMQSAWGHAITAVFNSDFSSDDIKDATPDMIFDAKLEKCKVIAHIIGESILDSANELFNKKSK